jgi:ATP-dependent exoDNAse (exonuclease V) beta subunit
LQKKFNIYRSSAGSGKTFTLTKEYLKLVLCAPAFPNFKDDYFKHILAVTFTKDAAGEMKERIISSLLSISKLAENQEDILLDAILQELQEEYPSKNFDKTILITRAGKVFANLLHNYSDFAVSTIDSFNNRIVQSFTRDMGLPFNYMVELEQEEILEQATQLLLEEAGEKGNQHLTKVLVDFALKQVDEEKSWDIEKLLQDFGTNIFQESKKPLIAQLEKLSKKDFMDSRQQLYEFKIAVEQEIKDLADKGMRTLLNSGYEEKDFYYGKTGIYGFFKKYAEQIDAKFFTEFANSYTQKTIDEEKWDGSKNKISISENLKLNLKQIFKQLEKLKEKYISDYLIVTSLLPYIYLLATINELDKKLKKLMSEKNKVHISDFNQKINQIVEKEPIPYIYERIGERFKHILIDEFQDTSQMQWHNLIPLIANALGFNFQNMLVGDAKQAIYRWRSGNADLIVHLPNVPTAAPDSPVAENAEIFRPHFSPKSLDRNFRSKGQIIDFNNGLFESLASEYSKEFPALQSYYEGVAQKIEPKNIEGGHVSISFLSADNDYDEATFDYCLKVVRNLVDNKGYSYRDIAILTRTNPKASKLAERFLAHKIQIISSESLLLTYSPKVNFIVSFLRVMTQPLNPSIKADLLYFLYDHFNIELAKNLPFDDNTHLAIGAVCNSFKFKDFANFIKDNFTKAFGGKSPDFKTLQYLSLYEVAEELIRTFQLNFDSKQQIYLQKLLDVMLDYGMRNSNNLSDFLDYWEMHKSKISITTPETGNAIRIMTIHKSKGLQFPVVILPYADWETTPKKGEKLWLSWKNIIAPKLKTILLPINESLKNTVFVENYQKEIQATFIDAVNLLYVALTRPEERIYITTKELPKKKSVFGKIRNVHELLEGYLQKTNAGVTEDEMGQHYLVKKDEHGKYSTKQHQVADAYELSYFLSTECRDKIRMRRDDKKVKIHAQHEVKSEYDIDIQGIYDARKHGLLIHHAFERVLCKTDVRRAVQRLENQGYISENEKAMIEEKMNEIVNLPSISDFFEKKEGRQVFNEKELVVKSWTQAKENKVLRPDRVVFDEKQITIIDYKTGIEKLAEHTRQLNEYAKAFEAMENFKEAHIQKFIIYTELLKVEQV